MFEKGEYIVYGTTGICEITDIKTMDISGVPKDRLFYVLTPYTHQGSKIFTPVDSTKTIMRRVISKEQAQKIIDDMPKTEELHCSNDKLREETYKECIRSCDCQELTKVIKTLYQRREQKLSQGKKFAATDERNLKVAEDNLFSELSVALGIERQDLKNYIEERLGDLTLA